MALAIFYIYDYILITDLLMIKLSDILISLVIVINFNYRSTNDKILITVTDSMKDFLAADNILIILIIMIIFLITHTLIIPF